MAKVGKRKSIPEPFSEAFRELDRIHTEKWRWEFLRLNPLYQADYDQIQRSRSAQRKTIKMDEKRLPISLAEERLCEKWDIYDADYKIPRLPDYRKPLTWTSCAVAPIVSELEFDSLHYLLTVRVDLKNPTDRILEDLQRFVKLKKRQLRQQGQLPQVRLQLKRMPEYLEVLRLRGLGEEWSTIGEKVYRGLADLDDRAKLARETYKTAVKVSNLLCHRMI